jgi:hypothetical protein
LRCGIDQLDDEQDEKNTECGCGDLGCGKLCYDKSGQNYGCGRCVEDGCGTGNAGCGNKNHICIVGTKMGIAFQKTKNRRNGEVGGGTPKLLQVSLVLFL